MTCPHCHASIAEGARFCGACGRTTSSTEPASSANLGEAPVMIGREIAGRYRILAKLGEGGMGTVYRAEQMALKRTVAVKLLRPDVTSNAMLLRRFNAEAEAVAKLSHPNTVIIYDFGQDTDGTLFIAMELIEGRSLRSVIHAEAPLPLRRALSIGVQVAASLSDAHSHAIIHRDLKPDNVMLQDRGRTRDVVRVLDFGIAKLRDDSRATQQAMTQAGDMLGTPQYMAPEQIRAEQIDGRTDVYALGCMLYEMVTARLPFEAPTVMALLSKHLLEHAPPPSQRRPDLGLPPAIDELVMTAMAKDPRSRPETMEAYGERIAALLATLPPDPSYAGPSGFVGAQPAPTGPRLDTPAASWAQPPLTPPPMGPASFAPPTQPPPYTPTPPPQSYTPPPPVPAAGSNKTMLIAIVAVVLLGGGIAAYALSTRGDPKPDEVVDDLGSQEPPVPDEPDDPDPPPVDIWANASDHTGDLWDTPSAPPAGETVSVGQGVQLILPPGFTGAGSAEGYAAAGPNNVALIVLPVAHTNGELLAKEYAARTNLKLLGTNSVMLAGGMRQTASFSGVVGGVQVMQLAAVYTGPGYQFAVIVHVPAASFGDDTAVFALEVFGRRVVLPSA